MSCPPSAKPTASHKNPPGRRIDPVMCHECDGTGFVETDIYTDDGLHIHPESGHCLLCNGAGLIYPLKRQWWRK